jgi:signaling intermediate in Toll pathway protein
VHEQEDGTILSMCITGTSSKDSVASWVKFLERENPSLAGRPVIFLLRSPLNGKQIFEEDEASEENLRQLAEAQKAISGS